MVTAPISLLSLHNTSVSSAHHYLNWLSPQNHELLSSLAQETRKLMNQKYLVIIRLLDLDADTDRVDGWFDQNTFVFISCDSNRVQ